MWCCELDSSTLVEKEKEQQIKVTTAKAAVEKSGSTSRSRKQQTRVPWGKQSLLKNSQTGPGQIHERWAVNTNRKKRRSRVISRRRRRAFHQHGKVRKVRDQARLGYANVNELESARWP
jgi:hypothetical protein